MPSHIAMTSSVLQVLQIHHFILIKANNRYAKIFKDKCMVYCRITSNCFHQNGLYLAGSLFKVKIHRLSNMEGPAMGSSKWL